MKNMNACRLYHIIIAELISDELEQLEESQKLLLFILENIYLHLAARTFILRL